MSAKGWWHVSSIGDGFEVEDSAGRTVLQAQQLLNARRASDHNERRANARMAAAAPQMLDALIAADEALELEGLSEDGPTRSVIRAAISSARSLEGGAA